MWKRLIIALVLIIASCTAMVNYEIANATPVVVGEQGCASIAQQIDGIAKNRDAGITKEAMLKQNDALASKARASGGSPAQVLWTHALFVYIIEVIYANPNVSPERLSGSFYSGCVRNGSVIDLGVGA